MPTPLLAHHIVQALPFFLPVLLIVLGLGGIVLVDRVRHGDDD